MPSPVEQQPSSVSVSAVASQRSSSTTTAPDPISSFLAGIAGGASSTTLLYPLDLIKVRMQVDENNNQRQQRTIDHAATNNNQARRRTICTTVRGVIQHEGYTGLYRGLTPALIGSAASWGGFFIIYEELKLQLLQRKKRQSAAANTALSQELSSDTSGQYYEISKDMHVDEEIDINTNNIIQQQPNQEEYNTKALRRPRQQEYQRRRLGTDPHRRKFLL